MNTARWMLAHWMLVDKERRWMKNLAHFVGSDRDSFDPKKKYDSDAPPSIVPLAALLNPEAYGKFVEHEERGNVDEVSDSVFEQQADALEKAGLLSDIDVMTDLAEEKFKKIQKERGEANLPPIDPDK